MRLKKESFELHHAVIEIKRQVTKVKVFFMFFGMFATTPWECVYLCSSIDGSRRDTLSN